MNRSLSTAAVLGGTVLAYYVALGRRHVAEIAARHDQMTAAYERFGAAELEVARETTLLECASRLDRWRAELTPRLIADPSRPFQLTAADDLRAEGLVVEGSTLLPDDATTGPADERVRIAVQGTLPRIFAAICNLENAPAATRVLEFTMQTSEADKVRAELTIVRKWSDPR